MKKLLFFSLAASLMVFGTSCNNDDSDDNGGSESKATEKVSTTEEVEVDDDVFKTLNKTTITDFGEGTGTITFTNDNVWILDGLVFVNEGQTLTIEAGTIIKGRSGQGENASALIVAKGGTIIAEGTAAMPIVFTSAADDIVRYADGTLDGGDNLSVETTGLWGGLIVLGNAPLNSEGSSSAIEGIPTTEPRGIYGGSDNADNSGILKYISIRHGGTNIGAGNEINGLTLGGVGNGTTIDYVEVISNSDDGIEFFGGVAEVKHAIVSYCADDSYDYDEGFDGKGQFWVTIQTSASDRGGEHDGGTEPEDGVPFATPVIYNASYIGADGNRIITFRDNAGGEYHNSIFQGFVGKGIDIEDLGDGEHSFARLEAGDLKIMNNVFSGNTVHADSLVMSSTGTALMSHANVSGNTVADAGLTTTNLIPTTADLGTGSDLPAGDAFYDAANYKGAFDPSSTSTWIEGWTRTSVEIAK